MSVRAYKVITKETETSPSFNLWHDQDLLDFLENQVSTQFFYCDDGQINSVFVRVKAIKNALKNKKLWEKDDYRIEQLKKDIAGLDDEDEIEYECY
jgi:hypothetical protein